MKAHFRNILLLLVTSFFLVLHSCKDNPVALSEGSWHGVMDLGNGKELPFQLNYDGKQFTVFNAEEQVIMNPPEIKGDSITIHHPVFEGVFKGTYSKDKITGSFIKPSLDRVVPFAMVYGEAERFPTTSAPIGSIDGSWEMIFSAHSEQDRYIAKGIFEQQGKQVTGTIRTTTGDYRYLEGVMDGNQLKLSTFDGAHAFLFEGEVRDSLLFGFFYSGNHWKEPFSGVKNESYELPDPSSLTYLNEGYDTLAFSFPDMEGNAVSLTDDRFRDKVVLVQIMGTWCPNCLEETRFLVDYLKRHPSDDLEVVSLAFEYAPTAERAKASIRKLITAEEVPYPVLLAQYGSSSKAEAQAKLPMLNQVLSYPTLLFIDRSGAVRKIHTGFNGTATGTAYTDFVKEFESEINSLLKE